ncbi:MAG: cupin [Actinomycetota bacterium]
MTGDDGRLVSLHTFTEPWDTWEAHPNGEELVLCLAGSITLHQEHLDGSTETVTIGAEQAVVNPPGTWHTADLPDGAESATALFITSGRGTDIRPR